MDQAHLQIAYQGDAIDDGTMDVHHLAPALMALGDFFHAANELLNADHARISVRVSAHFRQASFDLQLKVLQSWVEQARTALLGRGATEVKEIIDRLVLGVKGGRSLISFLKWLRNRKPENQTVLQSGLIRVEISGDYCDVDEMTLQLSRYRPARAALKSFVSPLVQEGIDKVRIRRTDGREESIEKTDLPAFDAVIQEEDVIFDSISESLLEIIRPSFDGGLKWKVSNGSARFDVAVEDERFLAEVEAGKYAFSKGDALRVRLRTRCWREDDGHLKSENTVIEVLKHVPRAANRQSMLPGTEEQS